jgi:hypothetical protein
MGVGGGGGVQNESSAATPRFTYVLSEQHDLKRKQFRPCLQLEPLPASMLH